MTCVGTIKTKRDSGDKDAMEHTRHRTNHAAALPHATVQLLSAQSARAGLPARRGHVRDRHVAQLVRASSQT